MRIKRVTKLNKEELINQQIVKSTNIYLEAKLLIKINWLYVVCSRLLYLSK